MPQASKSQHPRTANPPSPQVNGYITPFDVPLFCNGLTPPPPPPSPSDTHRPSRLPVELLLHLPVSPWATTPDTTQTDRGRQHHQAQRGFHHRRRLKAGWVTTTMMPLQLQPQPQPNRTRHPPKRMKNNPRWKRTGRPRDSPV